MVTDGACLPICIRDIKNVRLYKNITLVQLSEKTDIPIDTLIIYEDNPSDIPLTDAVKILSQYNINFKSVRFNRFQ